MQNQAYKVVIQLMQNDPAARKATLNQVGNILKALANVKIELVTHSTGIEMLFKEVDLSGRLSALHKQGVAFFFVKIRFRRAACTRKTCSLLYKSFPRLWPTSL